MQGVGRTLAGGREEAARVGEGVMRGEAAGEIASA